MLDPPKNPGPVWCHLGPTGDRDRRPGPDPVASPVCQDSVLRTFETFPFKEEKEKLPVFRSCLLREMQIVGKQPYRYIPAGMIGRIRSGICRIVAASFASLFSRFRLHASSCLRQQRSNRRQSSNYLSQDPMDREHQETKPAYTHTAEEAGL